VPRTRGAAGVCTALANRKCSPLVHLNWVLCAPLEQKGLEAVAEGLVIEDAMDLSPCLKTLYVCAHSILRKGEDRICIEQALGVLHVSWSQGIVILPCRKRRGGGCR
jgi:hypothetical protein